MDDNIEMAKMSDLDRGTLVKPAMARKTLFMLNELLFKRW